MRRRFVVTKTKNYNDCVLVEGTRVFEVHHSEASSRVVEMLKNVGEFDGSTFFLFEGIVRVARPGSNFLEETQ